MPLTPGSRLGPYEILAPLGAGGMGEVYRARDTRLKRDVAIKVLPADVASSPERLARFEREATTVAGLNHPNIVVLHSIEESGGTRFLTMELVEGGNLAESIVPGGLPVARVIDLGIAMADALAAAHEKGVVHRDLKPANVMLTKDGRVKVLDFGLARVAAADSDADLTTAATLTTPLSGAGHVVGTVPYMSPEQVRGEPVDARADLFALGIVLYELASGKRPFTGETPVDISHAILREAPKPLASVRRDLPSDLVRIVSRCLEKNPRERTPSALDLGKELRRLRRERERGESSAPSRPAAAPVASIAVLPFVNRSASAEDEYFSDGLADELLNVLGKIKGIRVTARTSSFYFKNKDTTIADIGRALEVATVLEGSVRKAGNRARISVQLVNVADSSHLWSETYDRTLEDIFAVQDDIAQSVVKSLRATLFGDRPDSQDRSASSSPGTAPGHSADPDAYDFLLRGRHQLNRRDDVSMHRAIEFFGEALARDPSYALAELGTAEAHALLGFHEFEPPRETFPRAREAALRALRIMPGLGEGHAVLAYLTLHHDRNWEEAEREFLRGIELAPRHAVSRLWYANVLLAESRFDEALEQGRLALEFDPLSTINSLVMGWVHFFAGRFDLAYDKMARALELDPGFFLGHQWRGWALWQMNRLDEAADEFETASHLAHHPPTVMGFRAIAAAFRGRQEECRSLIANLIATREQRFVSGFLIALGFIVLGDLDAAEPWIVRAADERSPWANYLKVDPRVAALRDRPALQAITARLGRGEAS